MRFDSSAYERAGQANAQANAAFGNALSMAAKGFYEGQEKKARAKEIEEDLIRNGEDPAAAKAISKNPFLQKEHQRREATKTQLQIEGNRLALQRHLGTKANKLRKKMFDLEKRREDRDIERSVEDEESRGRIIDFLLAPRPEEETPEYKELRQKFGPEQIPGTPEFQQKELSDPMGARVPIMVSQKMMQPDFERFRAPTPPGIARLPKRFQLEAQRIADATESGMLTLKDAEQLFANVEARAIAEAPKPMSPKEFEEFKKLRLANIKAENELIESAEPKPPQQPVYMQAALDAIEDSIGLIKKDSFYNPTAGFGAETMAKLGGTDAADLEAALSTITSSIGFDRLQKMREDSPTGGALGSVSERELAQLNAALGSISQKQSPEQLEKNLLEIKKYYQSSVDALAAQQYAYENGLPQFKNNKEALDFINQYKQQGQASAQASAQASPEVLDAINQKKKLIDSRRGRLLDNTPEYKVAQ